MTLERGRFYFLLTLLTVGSALLFLFVPSVVESPPQTSKPEPRKALALSLPATLGHRLRGGERQSFRFRLKEGEAFSAVLENGRDDLTVRVLDSSGTELFRIDSANGLRSSEILYALANQTGEYGLEILSGAAAGKEAHYRLKIGQPHTASERDRLRAEAMSMFSQGERLFKKDDESARRQAVASYYQALELWDKAGDSERASATRFRLGRVLQQLYGWGPAEFVLSPALAEVQARRDSMAEAGLLDRLGRSRLGLGELAEAQNLFQRSLELFRLAKYLPGEADLLGNLGVIARRLGDFQGGIKLDLQALQLWGDLGGLEEESVLCNNLGEIYLIDGQPVDALDFFERAFELASAVGSRQNQARALRGKGTAYGQRGQIDRALASLRKSIELWRELGDRPAEVISQVRLGDVFVGAERLAEAQDIYERALSVAQKSDDLRGQGMAMGNLGHVLDLQGHEQEGLKYYARARDVFERLGESSFLAKNSFGRAEAFRDLGEIGKARLAVEEAIQGFESFQSLSQRVDASADRRTCYELYVDVLMRLKEEPLAFRAAQAARFRTLLDDVGESRASTRFHDPELVKQKQELEKNLNTLELERWVLPEGSVRIQTIDREVRGLSTRLALVRRDLQARSQPDHKTLDLASIQKSLDRDSLLLVYFLGKDRSYLWEVTRDDFKSHVLGGRVDIENAAIEVRRQLSRPAAQPDWHRWAQALASMSRLVLAPVANSLGKRRLIIDPDGALNVVPFAALLDPTTLGRRGRPGDGPEAPRFLILDHETLVVPSISLIAARRKVLADRPPAPGTIAILADPAFGGQFPPLPQTGKEADAILAAAPRGRSFVARGYKANRTVATSPELGRYRILRFATHGLLRDRPDLSGIVLSFVDESGKLRDGFLRAFEIYDLDISSDLVVLSACETGLGSEQGGLVRGFLNAGARQVMATLWPVKDRSTARLMGSFYRSHLGADLSTPASLRRAQLDLLEASQWKSPHYWAGFTLYGDWE